MCWFPSKWLPGWLPVKCPPREIGGATTTNFTMYTPEKKASQRYLTPKKGAAVRYFETNPMRWPRWWTHAGRKLVLAADAGNFPIRTPWGAPTASTCDAMHDRTGTQCATKVRSKTTPKGGWLLGCIRNVGAKVHARADAKVSASPVNGSVSAQTRVAEAEVIEAGAQADAMVMASMVIGKVSPVASVRDGLVSKAVVSSAVSSKTALRRGGSWSGHRVPIWTMVVTFKIDPAEQAQTAHGGISSLFSQSIKALSTNFGKADRVHQWSSGEFPKRTPWGPPERVSEINLIKPHDATPPGQALVSKEAVSREVSTETGQRIGHLKSLRGSTRARGIPMVPMKDEHDGEPNKVDRPTDYLDPYRLDQRMTASPLTRGLEDNV
jgi:hypothetical protein